MKKFLILVALASALTGCDYLPTSENKVKKIVAESLLDPDSAKFKSISTGVNDGDFCGYVDGKNRMGGYTGVSPFIVNLKTGTVEIGGDPITKSDFKMYALMLRTSSDFMETVKEETRLRQWCTFPDRWNNSCKEPYPSSIEIIMGRGLCSAVTNGVQDGGYTIRKIMSEAFP